MNFSFRLKQPNSKKPTIIFFTTSFKDESKTFVYSTGEKVLPDDWDKSLKRPANLSGRKNDAEQRRMIDRQLSRYSSFFIETVNRFKTINEVLTTTKLKEEFDRHFKKVSKSINDVFKVYDVFLEYKKSDKSGNAIGKSTFNRYRCNKNLLLEFVEETKYVLRFKTINQEFYNRFLTFCIENKKHSTNTLSRNIGLLKTFLLWSFNNKYTFNNEFLQFKSIKRFITNEIALTLEQVKIINEFDLSGNRKFEKVRDLFVFGCNTGMRFSNYSKVRKTDVENGFIRVIDVKDKSKNLSIPITDVSKCILEKYDYSLPRISNQKFNKYLKELLKEMGFNEIVKKSMKFGDVIEESESPLYERISSHTARRTFITIMINKNVPVGVTMSITGHRSHKNFSDYYRPNEEEKVFFINKVFN